MDLHVVLRPFLGSEIRHNLFYLIMRSGGGGMVVLILELFLEGGDFSFSMGLKERLTWGHGLERTWTKSPWNCLTHEFSNSLIPMFCVF